VQGNAISAAASCSANPNCRAFTLVSNGYAYLKTRASPSAYREDTSAFFKN
jgi:hypothetical protein